MFADVSYRNKDAGLAASDNSRSRSWSGSSNLSRRYESAWSCGASSQEMDRVLRQSANGQAGSHAEPTCLLTSSEVGVSLPRWRACVSKATRLWRAARPPNSFGFTRSNRPVWYSDLPRQSLRRMVRSFLDLPNFLKWFPALEDAPVHLPYPPRACHDERPPNRCCFDLSRQGGVDLAPERRPILSPSGPPWISKASWEPDVLTGSQAIGPPRTAPQGEQEGGRRAISPLPPLRILGPLRSPPSPIWPVALAAGARRRGPLSRGPGGCTPLGSQADAPLQRPRRRRRRRSDLGMCAKWPKLRWPKLWA